MSEGRFEDELAYVVSRYDREKLGRQYGIFIAQ